MMALDCIPSSRFTRGSLTILTPLKLETPAHRPLKEKASVINLIGAFLI
jgi:hypothetical protein